MKSNELLPILVKIKELSLQLANAIDLVVDPAKKVAPEKEEKKVEEKTTQVVVEEPKKEITLVEVRTVLASISKDGYTNDVKALLRKYGSEKLSGIKPEDYEAILKDAEMLRKAEAK